MIQGAPMSPVMDESAALDAALQGDEAAFRDLVEPYHAGLHAHCYQMLASVQDAEDALQEALLKAWTRLNQFERRASFRTWVYTIATRTALDLGARRTMRVLPLDETLAAGRDGAGGRPVTETAWLEPYPADQLGLPAGFANPEARYELRESVELAFVAAVQHLAPRQRAVLLLREVLGFSASEAAETLGMTVAAVNSALERARAAVAQRCPDPSQQATLRALGDSHAQALVTRYMDALDRADLGADAGPARRGRDMVDAADAGVVWRDRGGQPLPGGGRVLRSLAAPAGVCQRPARHRVLHVGRGPGAVPG